MLHNHPLKMRPARSAVTFQDFIRFFSPAIRVFSMNPGAFYFTSTAIKAVIIDCGFKNVQSCLLNHKINSLRVFMARNLFVVVWLANNK